MVTAETSSMTIGKIYFIDFSPSSRQVIESEKHPIERQTANERRGSGWQQQVQEPAPKKALLSDRQCARVYTAVVAHYIVRFEPVPSTMTSFSSWAPGSSE